jgi:hypothetical protein
MIAPGTGKVDKARRPQRELSPLRRACRSLGLPVDAQPKTNLAKLLRKVGLEQPAIEYLQLAKGELARQIVDLYFSLNVTERRAVTIDYLILAADADAHQVAGLISEGVSRFSGGLAVAQACMSLPELTRRAINCAMRSEGFRDRELLFRMVDMPALLVESRRHLQTSPGC